MDLHKALQLLGLPREIGKHPDDAEIVEAGIGRYGPFVKHGRLYANLKEVDEVFTIGRIEPSKFWHLKQVTVGVDQQSQNLLKNWENIQMKVVQ